MLRPNTLQAFTADEYKIAHELLATKVAFMMGRKFEEGDWADVYCRSKNIPNGGWSNLRIDIAHNGIGIEHKMMRPSGNRLVTETYGTTLMHPSATRSIRISDGDPNYIMRDTLAQYGEFINNRIDGIKLKYPEHDVSLRTGWLLWQANLKDFLYFEEEVVIPNPDDYIAEWHENPQKGARRESKSLWIYEKETRLKRYSITTSAGAKIQPYFDVPPSSDPNLYHFRVQGEEYAHGYIRIWIPASIARELRKIVGSLNADDLDVFIRKTALDGIGNNVIEDCNQEEAKPVILTEDSYALLLALFPYSVSDAQMMRQLVDRYL
jgi:hypothetical protein